jgi:hypothetical protein
MNEKGIAEAHGSGVFIGDYFTVESPTAAQAEWEAGQINKRHERICPYKAEASQWKATAERFENDLAPLPEDFSIAEVVEQWEKDKAERDDLAKKLAEAAAMLRTARGALESYRYGNASPDLAEECVMAITNVLDGER